MLFEGLLDKIKNDLVKLLLNLNIVVPSEEENVREKEIFGKKEESKKVGRNENPCGSGKI